MLLLNFRSEWLPELKVRIEAKFKDQNGCHQRICSISLCLWECSLFNPVLSIFLGKTHGKIPWGGGQTHLGLVSMNSESKTSKKREFRENHQWIHNASVCLGGRSLFEPTLYMLLGKIHGEIPLRGKPT